MTTPQARLAVRNQKTTPHAVTVEPWGHDFTLLAGERLEILAFGDGQMPYFELVEWEYSTQVYCEETVAFNVLQDGVELECGHNRQTDA